MSLKRRLSMGVAAVALLAGAYAFADGPINPNGRPGGTHPGAVERYSLWHNHEGWHLRTMTKEREHHFRGKVDARGGTIVFLHGKDTDKGRSADHWKLGPEKHEITFDFSTKGGEDGIDWRVEGEAPSLFFTLEIGEKDPKFEPDRIFIGKDGAHPASNPFELPAHPAGGKHNK